MIRPDCFELSNSTPPTSLALPTAMPHFCRSVPIVRVIARVCCKWAHCSALFITVLHPRLDLRQAVADDKHIYVFGGFDGVRVIASCERYAPATGEW